MTYRYGAWDGGPDPLAPPYDLAEAVDELGDRVLAGDTVRQALRDLLRQGTREARGLESLRRDVARRMREARKQGRLDGTLEQVRELLDQALESERQALFPDPSDSARLAEAELDALPRDTARAVRELQEYPWRSEEARAAYEQIQDLLRREVLDSQFRGMKQALEGATPEDMQRVKDMLADLNAMLAADARGEHTQEAFDDFMADEAGVAGHVYALAGEPMIDAARAAMADYLAGHQGGRLGRVATSCAMFGLDEDDLHARFAPYADRFLS